MLKRILAATLLTGALGAGALAQAPPLEQLIDHESSAAKEVWRERSPQVRKKILRANPLCAQAFEEQEMAVWDTIAPEDPRDPQYLDDAIIDTLPSDWRTNTDPVVWRNHEPLLLKAQELYEPNATATENIQRIADWVRNSKEYRVHDYTGTRWTVKEIYNAESGVCYDAAITLTAMLRAVGIPAQAVHTYDKTHVITRAWADNRWVLVEATFAVLQDLQAHAKKTGDETALKHFLREHPEEMATPAQGTAQSTTEQNTTQRWPAYIYPEGSPFLAGSTIKPLGVCQGLTSPHFGGPLEEVVIYRTQTIKNEKEGAPLGISSNIITFPVSERKLYYSPCKEVSLEPHEGWSETTITLEIEEIGTGCLGKLGIPLATPPQPMAPFNAWKGTDPVTKETIDGGTRGTGYIHTAMPGTDDACIYKINYHLKYPEIMGEHYEDYKGFATTTFALGTTPIRLTITPDMLETCPTCYTYNFERLKDALREIPAPETLPVR